MKRIVLLFFLFHQLIGQTISFQNLTLDECIQLALTRNKSIEASKLEEKQAIILKRTGTEIPKTSVMYSQGQFNSIYKFDNSVAVNQTLPFPTVFTANKKLANSIIDQAKNKTKAIEAEIKYQVSVAFYSLQHHFAIQDLLKKEDSIYQVFAQEEKDKYSKGKGSVLEITVSENKVYEISNLILENEEAILQHRGELQKLLATEEFITIKRETLSPKWLLDDVVIDSIVNHPQLVKFNGDIIIAQRMKQAERNKLLPEINLGYTSLTIYGPANIGNGDYFLTTSRRLSAISAGINFQLWTRPYRAKIKALDLQTEITKKWFESQTNDFRVELKQSVRLYEMYEKGIKAFDQANSANYEKIITEAFDSYKKGEINYVDYLTIASSSLNTETHHLNAIHQNNLAYLRINYLLQK